MPPGFLPSTDDDQESTSKRPPVQAAQRGTKLNTGQNVRRNTRNARNIGILIGGGIVVLAGIVALVHNQTASSTHYKVGTAKTVEYSDGSTVQGNSGTLTVKLTGIIDPATTANGYGPEEGQKVVAVELSITSSRTHYSPTDSGTYFDGNVLAAVSATGSDGKSYTSVNTNLTGACQYRVGGGGNGNYNLNRGDTVNVCVPIALPQNVLVRGVKFDPAGDYIGGNGTDEYNFTPESPIQVSPIGDGAVWAVN